MGSNKSNSGEEQHLGGCWLDPEELSLYYVGHRASRTRGKRPFNSGIWGSRDEQSRNVTLAWAVCRSRLAKRASLDTDPAQGKLAESARAAPPSQHLLPLTDFPFAEPRLSAVHSQSKTSTVSIGPALTSFSSCLRSGRVSTRGSKYSGRR